MNLTQSKTAIWTLDIGNYIPELSQYTLASFKNYAHRIGADLNVITERKFPDWHIIYERAQIYELGQSYHWNILIDLDALIHPQFPDLTQRVPDHMIGLMDAWQASLRFKLNSFFYRDRRNLGVCGTLMMASRHCHDFWTPLPGVQADHVGEIVPAPDEQERGVRPEYFIPELWSSINMARFGLQYTGILAENEREMFFHPYGRTENGVFHSLTNDEKTRGVREKAQAWGIQV